MRWIGKLFRLLAFLVFYTREVLLANLKVAYDVMTPRSRSNPAIIAFPLEAKTDWEILTLANLISMTPGTLSVDVSTDRKVLYIHAMFVDDEEELQKYLKESIEDRVLTLFRS